MKVKITQGCAWYKGKEGRVFEVTKDDNHPSGFVYLLVEDINNPDVNWVRYIHSTNCVLVPDEPDELTRLRAELARAIELKDGENYDWDVLLRLHKLTETEAALARTQAALTAAGELIEAIRFGITGEITIAGMGNYERMKKGFEAYYAALASARGTETG